MYRLSFPARVARAGIAGGPEELDDADIVRLNRAMVVFLGIASTA